LDFFKFLELLPCVLNTILYDSAKEEIERGKILALTWPWNESSLPIKLPGSYCMKNVHEDHTHLNSEVWETWLSPLELFEWENLKAR